MINPNEHDIGRKVVYKLPFSIQNALGGYKSANEYAEEEGVITAMNDSYVFVRFNSETHSKAVKRAHLHWVYAEGVKQ